MILASSAEREATLRACTHKREAMAQVLLDFISVHNCFHSFDWFSEFCRVPSVFRQCATEGFRLCLSTEREWSDRARTGCACHRSALLCMSVARACLLHTWARHALFVH